MVGMDPTPHLSASAPVTIAVTLIEAPGRGWVADAVEIGAVAQGTTEAEAISNLRELIRTYPEVLDDVRAESARRVELVTV